MDEATIKAAARAAIKAGMDGQYSGGEPKYDQFAAAMEQAFYDALVASGLSGGGGGGTKKILYGGSYPSSSTNASSYPFTYWVSFFDYSYFYANTTYSTEVSRQMPIPGPGNIVRMFAKTAPYFANTQTAPAVVQLRSNGADVVGATFNIPATPPPDTLYDVTGSWPFNDGDQMCMRLDTGSAGNLYIRAIGLVVEV